MGVPVSIILIQQVSGLLVFPKRNFQSFFQGWVNPTRERVVLSKENPASARAGAIMWDHVDEVTIAGSAQAGQEGNHAAETTVTFHLAATAPRMVAGPPRTGDTWALRNLAAPADSVEAAFRTAAPSNVRVNRRTEKQPFPGAFSIALLVILSILTGWEVWTLLRATVGF
jgi:hypothetical protein